MKFYSCFGFGQTLWGQDSTLRCLLHAILELQIPFDGIEDDRERERLLKEYCGGMFTVDVE